MFCSFLKGYVYFPTATADESQPHSKEEAIKNSLHFYFVSAWITLEINSSLDSIGLTSAFSKELTEAGISCNVLAGYHHDHIFVPYHKKAKAMKILGDLFTSKK